MPRDDFSHVTHWVFDLDNTLYPPRVRLFDQIEQRMTAWVMRELGVGRDLADRLRHDYWARYGTTLAGLAAMAAGGFSAAVAAGMKATRDRAAELAR